MRGALIEAGDERRRDKSLRWGGEKKSLHVERSAVCTKAARPAHSTFLLYSTGKVLAHLRQPPEARPRSPAQKCCATSAGTDMLDHGRQHQDARPKTIPSSVTMKSRAKLVGSELLLLSKTLKAAFFTWPVNC